METEKMTLVELRRAAGFSRRQVAQAMGRSETTVTRMEAAYPDVMYSRLREYLRAIGRDVRFTGESEEKDIWADDVVNDPGRRDAVEIRRSDPSRMRPLYEDKAS